MCTCRMYINQVNTINLTIPVQTAHAMAKQTALLDSGATKNFISFHTWKQLGIGQQELNEPITVYNVNGTENKKGKIMHYCWLTSVKKNLSYSYLFPSYPQNKRNKM